MQSQHYSWHLLAIWRYVDPKRHAKFRQNKTTICAVVESDITNADTETKLQYPIKLAEVEEVERVFSCSDNVGESSGSYIWRNEVILKATFIVI